MGYIAHNLTDESRAKLLAVFPPRYEVVVCHHVTVLPNVEPDVELPPAAKLRIVGYASDELGLEALVVEVDGTVDRPVGSVYHITHSLVEGRLKVESNDVIANFGWKPLAEPIEIEGVVCFND